MQRRSYEGVVLALLLLGAIALSGMRRQHVFFTVPANEAAWPLASGVDVKVGDCFVSKEGQERVVPCTRSHGDVATEAAGVGGSVI